MQVKNASIKFKNKFRGKQQLIFNRNAGPRLRAVKDCFVIPPPNVTPGARRRAQGRNGVRQ